MCITLSVNRISWFSIPLLTLLADVNHAQVTEVYDLANKDLYALTFEQLSKIKIRTPGTITDIPINEAPVAITIITKDDILNSAARNILDLIEIYVPGAFWTNHEKGPSLGIRGIIENRNLKYLLLLNNRNINNKGHFGAKSTLELWDLNDIEKIEIIRGPGSVTYGPGAVAGVINITTEKADLSKKLEVSASYIGPYDSKGIAISHNRKIQDWQLHTYASIVSTKGELAEHFLANSNFEFGKIGRDVSIDSEPLDYFRDFKDQPQIKVNLDLSNPAWQLRMHYTQQGSHWTSNEVKTKYDNKRINQQGTQDRQLLLSLDHRRMISENVKMHASVSYDSYDSERRRDSKDDPNDFDSPLNKEVDFAENELLSGILFNIDYPNNFALALGAEIAWEQFGKGWGDDENVMRIGESGVLVNDANSLAIKDGASGSADRNGQALFVGNGWETMSYAVFSELNKPLTLKSKLLISARLDKNSHTPWMFSPRLAYIYNPNSKSSLRVIGSKSVRRNTAGQLYIENNAGQTADQEELKSLEVIYSSFPSEEISFSLSAYYNILDAVSFSGDLQRTVSSGKLKVVGAELEIGYQLDKLDLHFSYSVTQQKSWKLAKGIGRSGISYADYDRDVSHSSAPGEVFTITGFGNDLNNVPNQIAKLNMGYQFSPKMQLQVSSRVFHDYQGSKNTFGALQQALAGSSLEDDLAQVVSEIESSDVYDANFFMDVSLRYQISKNTNVQLFIQNITGNGHNKRYPWVGGQSSTAPNRVRYIEEPISVGIKFQHLY